MSRTKTLYHVGKRPPRPVPRRKGGVWKRPWLDEPVREAVFLTPNPAKVWYHDRQEGNCYVYDVPCRTIDKAGGIHRWKAIVSEVVIPKDLWKEVKFKGKMREGKWRTLKEQMSHDQWAMRSNRKPKTRRESIGYQGLLETDYPKQALDLLTAEEINELKRTLKEKIASTRQKITRADTDFREIYERQLKRKLNDLEYPSKAEWKKAQREAEQKARRIIQKRKSRHRRRWIKLQEAQEIVAECT